MNSTFLIYLLFYNLIPVYTMLQYLPYILVPFYPLFQERGAQKIERPKADWEVSSI